MPTFVYPDNATLTTVAQVIVPQLTLDDILFQLMPIKNQDTSILMWEQLDNFKGLQQVRGLNGELRSVKKVGAKTWMLEPGVYGEHIQIDERQLTTRRQYGSFNQPIDIADLVSEASNQLLGREIDRIRYIGWTLLSTGTFAISQENGPVLHTDSFNLQTYDASTWATVATATPLGDLRAVQQKGPEYGTDFNDQAVAIVNRKTANYMLSNTNAADLYGKRTQGLANILSMKEVNSLLTGEGLPNIVVYDKGYFPTEGGSFTRFVPDNKVIVVGVRPGNAPVANYLMTRNANNSDLGPGAFTMVEDSINAQRPPRDIKVYRGHNGGPAIYFPGSIVVMDVS